MVLLKNVYFNIQVYKNSTQTRKILYAHIERLKRRTYFKNWLGHWNSNIMLVTKACKIDTPAIICCYKATEKFIFVTFYYLFCNCISTFSLHFYISIIVLLCIMFCFIRVIQHMLSQVLRTVYCGLDSDFTN